MPTLLSLVCMERRHSQAVRLEQVATVGIKNGSISTVSSFVRSAAVPIVHGLSLTVLAYLNKDNTNFLAHGDVKSSGKCGDINLRWHITGTTQDSSDQILRSVCRHMFPCFQCRTRNVRNDDASGK